MKPFKVSKKLSGSVGGRGRKTLFRVLLRALTLFAVTAVGCLVWLNVAGFPDFVSDKVRAGFEDAGYDMRFDRLRFSFRNGVVAEQIAFYPDDKDAIPMLEAGALSLFFDARAWFRGELGINRVRVIDGNLKVNVDGPLGRADDPRNISLEGIHVLLKIKSDSMQLSAFRAETHGMRVEGTGMMMREPADPELHRPLAFRIEAFNDLLEQNRSWLLELVKEINSIEFTETPEAVFDFHVDPGNPEHNRISLAAVGKGTRLRGVNLDAWTCRAQITGLQLEISEFSAVYGERSLTAFASMDMETQILSADLHSSLPQPYLDALLPRPVSDWLSADRVLIEGGLNVDAGIGPVPVDRIRDNIRLDVNASKATLWGVYVEHASMSVHSRANNLGITIHEGIVGRDDGRGDICGVFETDLDTLAYSGSLRANFDPREILPLFDDESDIGNLIASLSFDGKPPFTEGEFSGFYRNPQEFSFAGMLSGADLLFRGAALDAFEAQIVIRDGRLKMDPVKVMRGEGVMEGVYEQHLDGQWVSMEIESDIDPDVVLKLGGQGLENTLSGFRFDGPVDLVFNGVVDYGDGDETDYTVVADAERLGWRWIMADTCSFTLRATGDLITIGDISMTLYGGEVEGHVELSGIGSGEPVFYDVEGSMREVLFGELIQHMQDTEEKEFAGRISSSFRLHGRAGEDWRENMHGEGRIRIRDGHIYQIPLLGGLSQILSGLYPGLGFASQTDLRADFDVIDRRVEFDDLSIEGNILSVRGRGHYDLNDDLDFRVQIQPLRRGFIVDAVRMITFPVSRLLQLRLRGTIDDPQWRIETIPRELYEIFERDG